MTNDNDEITQKLNELTAEAPEPVKNKRSKKEPVDAVSLDLTEAERAELEAQAQAEIAAELKAEKRKTFLAEAKNRLKKTLLFRDGKDEKGEEIETVFVSLAPYVGYIQLDGVRYYHNRAYRLGRATASVVKDQMFRSHHHDAETHGKSNAEFYGHQPLNKRINPTTPVSI